MSRIPVELPRPSSLTASALREQLAAGRRVVVATLVAVEGSAPLSPGATMVVGEDGTIEGTITGGCVESAVAQEAQAILHAGRPPALLTYGVSDELAATAGLMCGGTVHVFLHELDTEAAAATMVFLDRSEAGEPAGLATLLDGPRAGARLAVAGEHESGSLGGAPLLDHNVAADLRALATRGGSRLARYGADGSRLGADQRVHLHAHGAPPQVVVIGAVDFSAALAPIAAMLGYAVTIADPRAAFTRSPRFAHAAEVAIEWPAKAIGRLRLGPADAVLVFSHDPKLDVPAIMAALRTPVGYIGALGSRRTTAERELRLREAGATSAQLARVFAPCGLDIGGATVEETALAVLAEIVAHRAGRSGGSLRAGVEPIRARRDGGATNAMRR